MLLNGDVFTGPEARELVDGLQQEIWHLRAQVRHLRGERITKPRKGRCTFRVPTRRQSRAANKASRRTLQSLEPYLNAIWEHVEAADAEWWSVEGFENLILTIIRRGLPGSGARFDQRWTTQRLLQLLWDDTHCRHWLEKIRARTKIWTPNEFNAQQRAGHAGQMAWRKARKFMSRQMYGTDTLRSSDRESKALANLWTPIGTGFDEPDAAGGVATARAAAARARVQRTLAHQEAERKLLRSQAEKDLETSEAARAQQMKLDDVSPLTDFEAAGTALLLRNEPTKDEDGRKISATKRRASAAKRWSQGGEAGDPEETRVFEGAEVHHLVIADTECALNEAEALLGFNKVLVTEHEVFVDELHVAPFARRQMLSYHALDAVGLLQEPPEKLVRLQVDKANEVAVRAYTQASFEVWTPPAGGVWDKRDEAAQNAQMMATTVQRLADAVAHRCRQTPLRQGVEVLHFLAGDKLDHVTVEPTTDAPTREPRSDKERLAETCGTLNLHDPLAKQLIGRSLWNSPICSKSNASSFGFHISCDAGNFNGKGIDRRCRQISVVEVALKCWGVGDDDAWGKAHVRHGMPLSQSCDRAEVIRAWLGDDHAANLERGFVPYVGMMESLRTHGMTVPHMFLQLPPVLYDSDLNVEFRYGSRNSDIFAMHAVVSDVPIRPRGLLSMDLACENEYCGVNYSLEEASSWANNTIHADQSRIACVNVLRAGRTLEGECKRLWPAVWREMLAIALLMNDPSIEWSHATRKPEQEDKPAPPPDADGTGVNDAAFPLAPGRRGGAGRGGKRPAGGAGGNAKKNAKGGTGKSKGKGTGTGGAGGAGGAPTPRDVEVPEDEREQLEKQWVEKELRDRNFDFDSFTSDLDGSVLGAATSTSDAVRLIRMPIVDAFGERTSLPDMLGGDSEIARKYMGMCILHGDMRVSENIAAHFETRLRDRVGSNSSKTAALEKFNDAMNHPDLKVRHSIKVNKDTKAAYPVSFDGRDVLHLRNDWLRMEHLSTAELEECARTGVWPSLYFTTLHTALVESAGCEDVIHDLPEYAACAVHYSRAMREGRKMPADLRVDPEAAYVTFEAEARLFTAKWIKLGFSLKAYGFHLWANLPVLFRKWGSLEGMSQQAVEGTIGKLARLLPHLQLKPAGRYTKEVEAAGALAKLAELERRRAVMKSPAQTIVEEFSLETFESKYGISTKDKESLALREICLRIDEGIAAGRVVTHAQYKLYWQRYMAVESLRAWAVSSRQLARARRAGSTQYADLKREVEEYYSAVTDRLPVTSGHTNDEYAKMVQKLRSERWCGAARLPGLGGGKGGRRDLSGKLAYQKVARFPERWAPRAAE